MVVNPNDNNIIYISTAGGGAWKTIDGGKTWRQIFDSIPEIQTVTINTAQVAAGSTFTLSFTNPDNTGATVTDTTAGITWDPTNLTKVASDMQAALNALPNLGGDGVQLVTVGGTSGTFTLSYNGVSTGPLNFNAPASGANSVEDALNNLSSI